jgi:hypothetical protein
MEAGTLDDHEWHLALEMSTSRAAHVEREREEGAGGGGVTRRIKKRGCHDG